VRGEGAEREDGEKRSPKGIVCKYFMTDVMLVSYRRASKRRRCHISHHPHPRRKRRKRNQGAWV
jgi:hypothetical protein